MAKEKKLGMGLSALLGEEEGELMDTDIPAQAGTQAARGGSVTDIDIALLSPSRFQPRTHFEEEAIAELSNSIRERGIIQPILVRESATEPGHYEIIAGERRWRAAQRAQLHQVPVLIRSFDDRETAEIALIENLQRQDLSPLEEAEGYLRLMDEFEHTQEALGNAVGKSRSHIANALRLLALPDDIKAMVQQKRLSAGHARALIGAEAAETLALEVVKKGLNVRQTEALVKKSGGKAARPRKVPKKVEKDADTLALENDLTAKLGLTVSIDFDGMSGKLSIQYDTLEQLDDILQRLALSTQAGSNAVKTPADAEASDPVAESEAIDAINPINSSEEDNSIDLNQENELADFLNDVADQALGFDGLKSLSDDAAECEETEESGDTPAEIEEIAEDEILDAFLDDTTKSIV